MIGLTWAPRRVMRRRVSCCTRSVALSLLWLAAGYGCTPRGSAVEPSGLPAPEPPAASVRGLLPPACEARSGDVYRTLVASRIEALGARHVLTIACEGIHILYLGRAQPIDITPLLGQPICASYRYVDQPRSPMPCLRPPCPEGERVLSLVEVRSATATNAPCGNP